MSRESRVITKTLQDFTTVNICDECGKEEQRDDSYRGMLPKGWYGVRREDGVGGFSTPDDRDFCSHECLVTYYWTVGEHDA